jgi:uncharacterized protein (DUF952 family)
MISKQSKNQLLEKLKMRLIANSFIAPSYPKMQILIALLALSGLFYLLRKQIMKRLKIWLLSAILPTMMRCMAIVTRPDTERWQKIVSVDDFLKIAAGGDVPLQAADNGSPFIHCTHPSQTADKIAKFFKGPVYVFELDTDKLKRLGFELRRETNPNGTNLYPHLYHTSGVQKRIPGSACIPMGPA